MDTLFLLTDSSFFKSSVQKPEFPFTGHFMIWPGFIALLFLHELHVAGFKRIMHQHPALCNICLHEVAGLEMVYSEGFYL